MVGESEMASSVEKEGEEVVSLELPAPSGWVKKVYSLLSLYLSLFCLTLLSFPSHQIFNSLVAILLIFLFIWEISFEFVGFCDLVTFAGKI